jgi:hypothetical protein
VVEASSRNNPPMVTCQAPTCTPPVPVTCKHPVHAVFPPSQVAWVTKAGNSEMEKPIAIRPTSETVSTGHRTSAAAAAACSGGTVQQQRDLQPAAAPCQRLAYCIFAVTSCQAVMRLPVTTLYQQFYPPHTHTHTRPLVPPGDVPVLCPVDPLTS